MKIHQLRNATMIVSIGDQRLLVDPMLGDAGCMAGFKLLAPSQRRPNPTVSLPDGAQAGLDNVTGVLVTHEHPDHLDPAAVEWIKSKGLPVYASSIDVPNLRSAKGLDAREATAAALGMPVEVIPALHGHGPIAWAMGPSHGYYLASPNEPSIYITGDAVLTDDVRDALTRLKPDIVVAPAGSANFGQGPDILFSVDELVELAKLAPGKLVLNHIEALDHCPNTRMGIRERMEKEGVPSDKVVLPADGETLTFEKMSSAPHAAPKERPSVAPGFQKWLTSWIA